MIRWTRVFRQMDLIAVEPICCGKISPILPAHYGKNAMKKNHLLVLLLPALLAACQTAAPVHTSSATPARSVQAHTTLAASHWGDVAKIRAEATRLGYEVAARRLTKAQAAQALNRFRIGLVGHNAIDDDVYAVYLRSAVHSQQGRMTAEQSRTHIQTTLRGWQQRWPHMQNRPNNPALTNFLMEVMNMEPLK